MRGSRMRAFLFDVPAYDESTAFTVLSMYFTISPVPVKERPKKRYVLHTEMLLCGIALTSLFCNATIPERIHSG